MTDHYDNFVKVVPYPKIKQEVLQDEDDVVNCRLCLKGFVTEIALRNHVRMEHFDAYATGDSNVWTEYRTPTTLFQSKPNLKLKIDEEEVKIKTEKVVSSFEPTNIMRLASNDVSYIIIKAEQDPLSVKKKKTEKAVKVEKVVPKKQKEIEVIAGPFECLQPSNLGGDGVCHQMFFSCCEYSLHYRDEHTRRRKGLRCQVCEKPLAGIGDPAPFSCEICGDGFDDNNQLAEHMTITHVKVRPYECAVCHKRFTQQGGLYQHMRMHTGDRPFPCTFCPKAFTQKSGLDQHLRIHTKVKPYRCVICSKSFCQSVHLKQHMRTHTNVAPFQCGICEKRFKQSSHLNYHLKNHNRNVMTEEQKIKYAELLGMIAEEVIETETITD